MASSKPSFVSQLRQAMSDELYCKAAKLSTEVRASIGSPVTSAGTPGAGTAELAWRACASFVGLSLRHPSKAETSSEEESSLLDTLAPSCLDLVRTMLYGAGLQGQGVPAQSTRNAATLLLAALVHMAAGDSSSALPLALHYISCRPSDESGHALLACLCAGVLGEGVHAAMEQAGREEGCSSTEPFAHYLLHPLQCVVCCSPLRQPVTDSTGVTHCASCSTGGSLGGQGGRGTGKGRSRSGSRSEPAVTGGRSSKSSGTSASSAPSHAPIDTTVQALVDLAWPVTPYLHGPAMEQATAAVESDRAGDAIATALRALEAAPPSLWPDGFAQAAALVQSVGRGEGGGWREAVGPLCAYVGIPSAPPPSPAYIALHLYLRAMASAHIHALLLQHAHAAALASSGRQEIEGEAGRTVTVARARGRGGRANAASSASTSSLSSSGVGNKRARAKSRGSLDEMAMSEGVSQGVPSSASPSLLLDSDTATDILQWARAFIRALPLPGSPEDALGGLDGIPPLHRACVSFSSLLARIGEAEAAQETSPLSSLVTAVPSLLNTTLQPLLQALPAAVKEMKEGQALVTAAFSQAGSNSQVGTGAISGAGAGTSAVAPASPGQTSSPDAKRARVHGGAATSDAASGSGCAPGTSLWHIRGLGMACSPAYARPLPKEELSTCLDCPLCYTLLYQPVTLPECQHTFCKECLIRCLDHKAECPTCRADLSALLASHIYPINASIDRVVRAAFPSEYKERQASVEAERREAEKRLPIFVCGLVLPHEHCPLHVFEPRYRLMMRRAMQSGHRAFGMAVHLPREDEDDVAFHDLSTSMPGIDSRGGRGSWQYSPVGVRVSIASMKLLPDGRSLVDCTAEGSSRRYKVVQRHVRDGYHVGVVEWIVDWDWEEVGREILQGEGSQLLRDLRTLVSYVHALVLTATSGLSITHCSFVLDGVSRRPASADEAGARGGEGGGEHTATRAARTALPPIPQQSLVQRARMLQLGASQFRSNWDEEPSRPPPCPPVLLPLLFPQGGELPSQPAPMAVAQALDVYLWSLLSRLPVNEEGKMRALHSSSLRERVGLVRGYCGTLGKGEEARQQAEDGYDEVGRLCGSKGTAAVSLLLSRVTSRMPRCPWLSAYLPSSTRPADIITATALSRACDITVNVGHVMLVRMGLGAGGGAGGPAAMLQSMLASLLAGGGQQEDDEGEDSRGEGSSAGEGDSGSGTGEGSDEGEDESVSEGGGRGPRRRGAAGPPGLPPGECSLQ